MTTSDTDSLHDELAAHLARLAGVDAGSAGGAATGDADAASAPDPYRVDRVLKESAGEVTQLVWFRGIGGAELGPFVRKLISPDSGLGGAYREVFEAQRAGRRFRHLPRIVECHETPGADAPGADAPGARAAGGGAASVGAAGGVIVPGMLTVVMERVPGPTLREVVEGASASQRELLANRLVPALCDAVTELHESFRPPIIHRDLTPGNVICPEADPTTPVLIDLGIARSWRAGASADTVRFGTRAYAPPEQFGFGQTDVRSDVYALGMLAFFCLTGRDPEPADREAGFAVPGVPPAWRAIIVRAAAFDPAERFGSAHELAAAVRKLVAPQAGGLVAATPAIPAPSAAAVTPSAPIPQAPTAARRPAPADASASASVVSIRPPQPAPSKARPVRFLTLRNVVVGFSAGLFVFVSITCAFDPARYVAGPVWYNVLGYTAFIPALALSVALFAMDKRWLLAHVAPLRGRTPRDVRRLALKAFGIAFGLFVVLSLLTQA